MSGGWLLVPFLLIRFGLLAALRRQAAGRAAHFAPVRGGERIAYGVYQLSNLGIFAALFFLSVEKGSGCLFYAGGLAYLSGLVLLAAALVSFASPDDAGMNADGLYRFSRNPMYAAYFLCFIGMALLTRSAVLLGLVIVFQISAHWIILAEERWCLERFGPAYQAYMERVRRYL